MGELIDFEKLPLVTESPPSRRLRAGCGRSGLPTSSRWTFRQTHAARAVAADGRSWNALRAARVGKTHVALEAAYAVATVKLPALACARAAPVLLIDGEMPAGTLQERLSCISNPAYGIDPPSPILQIVASDLHSHGLPDLSDPRMLRPV